MTLCRNLGGNKLEARSTKDSDQSSLKSNLGQGIARAQARCRRHPVLTARTGSGHMARNQIRSLPLKWEAL